MQFAQRNLILHNAILEYNLHNAILFLVVLLFCRVITAQVDYIIALSDKDNYVMQM